jgi:hypothetical protein
LQPCVGFQACGWEIDLRTQFIIGVIALAVIGGCVKRPPSVDFEKDYLEEKARYEPNLGKDYWLMSPGFLCPTATTNKIDCALINTGTKLQPDGIERGITSDAHYHVKLEDGRTGYISAFELVASATNVDPAAAAADCVRRGNPRVGMTAKQVKATCWGEPNRVDHRETARGTTERYVYEKGKYVLLHNGIVTSVQVSGTLR